MPQIDALNSQTAYAIREKVDKGIKMMHRVTYFSEIHPDETDLAQMAMVKVTVNFMAVDANEAYALFSNNVPDEYPVLNLIGIGPVEPVIMEHGMLDIARGPRRIN